MNRALVFYSIQVRRTAPTEVQMASKQRCNFTANFKILMYGWPETGKMEEKF